MSRPADQIEQPFIQELIELSKYRLFRIVLSYFSVLKERGDADFATHKVFRTLLLNGVNEEFWAMGDYATYSQRLTGWRAALHTAFREMPESSDTTLEWNFLARIGGSDDHPDTENELGWVESKYSFFVNPNTSEKNRKTTLHDGWEELTREEPLYNLPISLRPISSFVTTLGGTSRTIPTDWINVFKVFVVPAVVPYLYIKMVQADEVCQTKLKPVGENLLTISAISETLLSATNGHPLTASIVADQDDDNTAAQPEAAAADPVPRAADQVHQSSPAPAEVAPSRGTLLEMLQDRGTLPSSEPAAAQKGWFDRNSKYIVPALIVAAGIALAFGAPGLFGLKFFAPLLPSVVTGVTVAVQWLAATLPMMAYAVAGALTSAALFGPLTGWLASKKGGHYEFFGTQAERDALPFHHRMTLWCKEHPVLAASLAFALIGGIVAVLVAPYVVPLLPAMLFSWGAPLAAAINLSELAAVMIAGAVAGVSFMAAIIGTTELVSSVVEKIGNAWSGKSAVLPAPATMQDGPALFDQGPYSRARQMPQPASLMASTQEARAPSPAVPTRDIHRRAGQYPAQDQQVAAASDAGRPPLRLE
jgi:hypothetical protein